MESSYLYLYLLVVFVLLLLEGFFSGSEMAFISISPVKAKGNKKLEFFIRNTDRLLATTLLGTNLCMIANSSFVTYLVRKHLHTENELITVAILSPLVLIFGETIPKTIAKNRPEAFTRLALSPFTFAYRIFSPFTLPLLAILRALGQDRIGRELLLEREELPLIIEPQQEAGDIKRGEIELIKAIINLRGVRVKEALKPIIKVRTLEKSMSVQAAIEASSQTGYTRFPVYERHIYNIKGMLNIFDILEVPPTDLIEKYVKPALFVSEIETVWSALKRMQANKLPLAVVVDEYGAATGILTIEDVLEELVGEIADEYDLFAPSPEVKEISPGVFLVPGNTPVDVLEEKIGIELPKREIYETVAGLVTYFLDKIPSRGDVLDLDNVSFIVKEADEKQIKLLEVRVCKK